MLNGIRLFDRLPNSPDFGSCGNCKTKIVFDDLLVKGQTIGATEAANLCSKCKLAKPNEYLKRKK